MNIGIIGDGQLGWMTIFESRKLNYNFFVLGNNVDAPASRIADKFFRYEEVDDFLKICDEVVFEFEHIPEFVFKKLKNHPNFNALKIKRSRIIEKNFLSEKGYPVAKFSYAYGHSLKEKIKEFSLPVVIKAETLGYDGKGQYVIKREIDLNEIFKNHSLNESFIIEEFIDFKYEVSAIGVRDKKGNTRVYPISFNFHKEGILIYNYVPFIENREIEKMVISLMEDLGVVGLLAVEFFIDKNGNPVINEFAPRPHNTGHWTMDGAYTSQFENLIRAVSGLPIGSTDLKVPTGMVNILGKSLDDLDIEEILKIEGTELYWYGKSKKEKRKMGHINIVSNNVESLEIKLNKVINLIKNLAEETV
jgi:5-(carboxyamino)imidazole ribonucleotide synthase